MQSLHAAARAGGSSRDAMIDGHCKAEAEAEAEELKHARAAQWGERQNSQRQDSMPSLHAAARAGCSSRDAHEIHRFLNNLNSYLVSDPTESDGS